MVLLKYELVVKLKLRRIDKLFTDLIFLCFRVLRITFKMDAFDWFLLTKLECILIHLDLIQPGRNLRQHCALDLMSWVYGRQWGMLGFEHEKIECENKLHIKLTNGNGEKGN